MNQKPVMFNKGFSISKVAIYAILLFWSATVVLPMVWATMSAFKSDQEIFFSPWGTPAKLLWENFSRAWVKAQLGQYMFNTFVVILPAIFLTLLMSAMVAYVLARYTFRGKSFIFYLFLSGMMFPMFLALVPLYFVTDYLGLRNTYVGLILVYVAFSLPFTIFFMVGFFKTLPKELSEAAIIDGANHYQTFFSVMLPLAKPGLISAAIFNFLGQWNQFILPTVLMTNEGLPEGQSRYLISQGLYFLQAKQGYESDLSGMFAAVVIVTIPALLIYILFQDRIEAGLTVGAVKG
ncbi:MAG: carbohydrate ABC transporter permease [Anaerolineae bacterium]|nr:carbohydrate ABC transporter permease [Anaerolineae bacterium]